MLAISSINSLIPSALIGVSKVNDYLLFIMRVCQIYRAVGLLEVFWSSVCQLIIYL